MKEKFIPVVNRQLFFHPLGSIYESRIPLSVLDNPANWQYPTSNQNAFVVRMLIKLLFVKNYLTEPFVAIRCQRNFTEYGRGYGQKWKSIFWYNHTIRYCMLGFTHSIH